MASFDDLDQYLETGDRLKVRGKVYTVPPRSAALGIWCRRIVQTAGELTQATTDEELREVGERAASRAATMPSIPDPELSFEEQLLGPAYAEMLADNVPDDYLVFCARTIFIKLAYGEEYAERWWRSGGHPEAVGPVPNRADRRRTGGTSTAEAATTIAPASTSGTTSRRRSGRRRGAGRSRGGTS
jgi:hypothetical protein